MGMFDKIKEPVFLKEGSSAGKQLEELTALRENIPLSAKKDFERDLRLLKAGIYGEDHIAYEIKNSHMPMWVIHDFYIEYEGLTAQIDYLIITRKRNFIIECKNLIGNIEVNSSGDFIRIFENGKKEGIYSPITQNRRHLELIRKMRIDSQNNLIMKTLVDRFFEDNWRSVVVLANPKTYLNSKYAKKEVRSQVIRADRLIDFIRGVNSEKNAEAVSEAAAEKFAERMLSLNKECPMDLVDQYTRMIEIGENGTQTKTEEVHTAVPEDEGIVRCPRCGAPMVRRVAARGVNEGRRFYGCSNYPKCRGIVPID